MNFFKKSSPLLKGIMIGVLIVVMQATLFFGCMFGISGEGKIVCGFIALPVLAISFVGINILSPPDIPSYEPASSKEYGLYSRYPAHGVHYIRYADDAEYHQAVEKYDEQIKYFYVKLILLYSSIIVFFCAFVGFTIQKFKLKI